MTIAKVSCPLCKETYLGHSSQRRVWSANHVKSSHPEIYKTITAIRQDLREQLSILEGDTLEGLDCSLLR